MPCEKRPRHQDQARPFYHKWHGMQHLKIDFVSCGFIEISGSLLLHDPVILKTSRTLRWQRLRWSTNFVKLCISKKPPRNSDEVRKKRSRWGDHSVKMSQKMRYSWYAINDVLWSQGSLGKQPHADAVEVFDEGMESQDEAEIATFYSRLCCHPGLKEVELQWAS